MDKEWLVPAYLLVAGTVFFCSVYNTTRHVLTKCYGHRLTKGDIYMISEKVTCSTQAVMAFSVGFIIVSQIKDIMADTHWLTNTYPWWGLPYLAQDVLAMYRRFYWTEGCNLHGSSPYNLLVHFMHRHWLIVMHHVLLPAVFFPILLFWRGNKGDFYVGCGYMMEVSVPFVSLTAVLDQLQMKNTTAYLVNGILMLFTFFSGRILLFPYLYWRYACYAGMGVLEVPVSIPIKCSVGCFLVLLLQVYWFWLMLRKAVRYLKQSRWFSRVI